jgi:hypothetical protein
MGPTSLRCKRVDHGANHSGMPPRSNNRSSQHQRAQAGAITWPARVLCVIVEMIGRVGWSCL